jgi:hypothetical protein
MKYKKSIINIFIFFFLALVLVGCFYNPLTPIKGDDSEIKPFCFDSLNVEEINELILGKWEWDYSIIMQRNIQPPNNIISPESVGYTKQRYFGQNDTVSFFKDNQLIETHKYEIKKFKMLPSDAGYVTEIFIDEKPYQLYFSHQDTMMIGNGWTDGIN